MFPLLFYFTRKTTRETNTHRQTDKLQTNNYYNHLLHGIRNTLGVCANINTYGVRIFDNKSTAVRWNFGGKFEKPRIILILICMCIACAFLCALSRYFLKSFRMYETTGSNTRGASWVSVEILHVEFIKQFSNFKLLQFLCLSPASWIYLFIEFHFIQH